MCGLLLFSLTDAVRAQIIPAGTVAAEDYYRRQQLLGTIDSDISFTAGAVGAPPFASDTNKYSTPFIKLLPVTLQQQVNSHHPYGWNDGAMIPARGYQAMFSAGVSAGIRFLAVKLQPEYVYAQNSGYAAYDIYAGAPDLPVKFGEGPYRKLVWGQSSVRINAGAISIGLSNENLKWGPGVRNSLVMSNNAPGFKHLTFNSNRPVKTPAGTIEFQMIGGKLESSGHTYLDNDTAYSDWRYVSALAFSYQPKWIPGLFVGLTRSFQTYHKNLKKPGDYLPIIRPYQKVKDEKNSSGGDDADQLTSLFARWLFVKSHAEIYLEYGLNDHSYNLRDFLGSPEHSRAYVFGMTKLIPVQRRENDYIQVRGEITQMSQSIDRVIRNAGAWYYHSQILQGYTHKGQMLGAGVGPGGNLQSLEISWNRKFKQLGLQLERYRHDADYYDAIFANGGNWVDFSAAAVAAWDYKNLLFNTKIQAIQSLNYQWKSGINGLPKQNVVNLHVQLGVTYRF